MKLYKSIFVVAAIICGMMTSCSDDGYWDKAAPASLGLTDGTAFSFNNKSLSYVYYPADVVNGTDVNVTVTRGNASGAFTLPIAAEFSDSTLISGPESVTFADGQNTATYPIHFLREIEIGEAVSATLVIDTTCVGIPRVEKPVALKEGATAEDSTKFKADSTAYAIYLTKLGNYKLATTVSINKDYNWVSLGKGKMTEGYYFGFEEAGNVEIKQAQENSRLFRVVSPWDALFSDNGHNPATNLDGNQTDIQILVLQPGETLNDVTITQKDLVYFKPSNMGYINSTYNQDVWIFHPADISSSATEDKWLHNKVLSYQADGKPAVIQLAPRYWMIGLGGWNQSQNDDIITITFPGVKIYDYSATIEYAGLFTDPSNVVYALADYELTGVDAQAVEKDVKVAIVNQSDDAEAVADAIAAGDFEATSLKDVAKDGRIQMPLPADANGKLQMILVVIDKNEAGANVVKNVVAAKFEYFGGADPWETLGVGYYTDDLFYTFFTDAAPITFEVEVQQYTATPGLYRMKAPYAFFAKWWNQNNQKGDGDADIEIHAENPNGVYILDQPLGLNYSALGDMSFESEGGYYVNYYAEKYTPEDIIAGLPNLFGKVENGVITLPVLEQTDSEGNVIKDEAGNIQYYQGWMNFSGGKYYSTGNNGAFKLVLPGASAEVRAKAASRAKASDFAMRLNPSLVASKKLVMRHRMMMPIEK